MQGGRGIALWEAKRTEKIEGRLGQEGHTKAQSHFEIRWACKHQVSSYSVSPGKAFRGVTACPPFVFKAGRKIGPEQDPPLDLYYQPIKDFTHFFRLNVFFPFHPHRVSYIFLSFSYSLFSFKYESCRQI